MNLDLIKASNHAVIVIKYALVSITAVKTIQSEKVKLLDTNTKAKMGLNRNLWSSRKRALSQQLQKLRN